MIQKSTVANVPKSAFHLFFKELDESRSKLKRQSDQVRKKIQQKEEALIPIESLLKGLSALGVHLACGREFSYYKKESSPSWAPGISILFDHPFLVEIAIPNVPKEEGAVVIRVISDQDPHANVLNRKFESVVQATESLAKYLGRHSIALEMDPRTEDVSKLQAIKISKREESLGHLNKLAKAFEETGAPLSNDSPKDRISEPQTEAVMDDLLVILEGESDE
jgi:hypothetical protein